MQVTLFKALKSIRISNDDATATVAAFESYVDMKTSEVIKSLELKIDALAPKFDALTSNFNGLRSDFDEQKSTRRFIIPLAVAIITALLTFLASRASH